MTPTPIAVPSPPPSLSRRLWMAGVVQRYPSFESRVHLSGHEEAPDGMALIRARSVRYLDQQVAVLPFYLDKAPVTNRQYRKFAVETGDAPPPHWTGWKPPRGYEDHPVVGVDLAAARRYAAWRGVRLPTEVEWASAVKGPGGERRFPWGPTCDGLRCHCPLMGHTGPGPVKAHPSGATPEGCEDMYGNVWEWTEPSPRYDPAKAGHTRVLGGSYAHRCTAWGGIPMTEVLASKGHVYVGFRCAATASASA